MTSPGYSLSSLIAGLLICFLFTGVDAQVVIVPSWFRTDNSAARPKTRTKKGSPKRALRDIDKAVQSSAHDLDRLQSLSFAIKAPHLSDESMKRETKRISLPVRLSKNEFKVISADARGRILESRLETSRYFSEELPGEIYLEMVELPGGIFVMGSEGNKLESIKNNKVQAVNRDLRAELPDRLAKEMPQHTVNIQAIFMGRNEITQSQWRAVAGLPRVRMDLMSDPSHFKGGARPVENISWEEAMEFCDRLSQLTWRHYRLPTESEWEYACRAGTDSPFSFGESITPDWANYNGRQSFGASPKGKNRNQTLPAGSLGIANAFGLFDMHGNVREWCLDTWSEDYGGSMRQIPIYENDGLPYLRILRGGSWGSSAGECRSGARLAKPSILRDDNIGFRVVVDR